jgi:hypothetical protein
MQILELKYAGNNFIANDLKRLKNLRSLVDDLNDEFKVISGYWPDELPWPPPNTGLCDGLITQYKIDGELFKVYKDRIPIAQPKMSPSKGCRLIFAIGCESFTFIPLLLYSSKEEKATYLINNKKFPLTSSNLGKIIGEKLR